MKTNDKSRKLTAAEIEALNSGVLNPRERYILEARRLAEEPMTLEALSIEFGLARERIRQIEARAFEKVQSAVKGIEKA
jgi:RNA polymerase sigma-32 factor